MKNHCIPKIQNTGISNTKKHVEQQKLSFIVDKNAKFYGYFGQEFDNFLQNQTHLSIDLTIILLGIYSNEWKCPHKNLHINVNTHFIHNYQYLGKTNMSFNRWMKSQTEIEIADRDIMKYYSAAKYHWWMNLGGRYGWTLNAYCWLKETSLKRLHTIIPIIFWKKQSYRMEKS